MPVEQDVLLSLYQTMVRIRCCEESLVDPILKGPIETPCHLYSGQEAIAAGVCENLEDDDVIFGNHRSHGHFLAKGGSMRDLIAEIYARETGCSRGRGGSMHLIDPQNGMLGSAPIVAGTVSLAVGAAFSILNGNGDNVAVSFFGDGAMGEGVVYESMNFAGLQNLPVIFVCENNLYSTHMPIRDCRVDSDIFESARSFNVKSYQIDGNDAIDVFETTDKAVGHCKNGDGPVFIECLTYRMRGHVGPDDNIHGHHTDIRPDDEVERWSEKDPIKRLESYLVEQESLDRQNLESIRKSAETEVAEAHNYAKESDFPAPDELMEYIYA